MPNSGFLRDHAPTPQGSMADRPQAGPLPASTALRPTLSESCGLTQLPLLAEREHAVTPSLAHHVLPMSTAHAPPRA